MNLIELDENDVLIIRGGDLDHEAFQDLRSKLGVKAILVLPEGVVAKSTAADLIADLQAIVDNPLAI